MGSSTFSPFRSVLRFNLQPSLFRFHRRLSQLRGRAHHQPRRLQMDHAAAQARREKILPGDLLQGIFPLPITLIYLSSSPRYGHHRIISVPVTLLASRCIEYQTGPCYRSALACVPSASVSLLFVSSPSLIPSSSKRNFRDISSIETKGKCYYFIFENGQTILFLSITDHLILSLFLADIPRVNVRHPNLNDSCSRVDARPRLHSALKQEHSVVSATINACKYH